MPTEQWSMLVFTSEVILVSLAVGILLLVLIRRSRRQINYLEADNHHLRRLEANSFIERELGYTRALLRSAQEKKQRLHQLLRLRRLWLEAEQKALVDAGYSASDTAVLMQSAGPLLVFADEAENRLQSTSKNINVLQSATTSAERKQAPEQARRSVTAQKEIVGQLRQRLFANPSEKSGNGSSQVDITLQQVDSAANSQRHCIENLERNFESAEGGLRRVASELTRSQTQNELEYNRASSDIEGMLIISTDQPRATPAAGMRSWLDELESSHAQSMRELASMREINSRQRRLILQLEKEIEQIKKSEDEYKGSQQLLDNLREQLRNYENCTVILETEAEELRSRIAVLNQIIEEAERAGAVNLIEQMHQGAIQANRERDQYQRYVRASQHVRKIAEAISIEAAIPHLLAWQRDLDLDCVSYIKGNGKQYWLTGDGSPVNPRVRQLLSSFVPVSNQPWTQVREGIIFVGSALHLFIQNTSISLDRLRENIELELAIINSLLQHLERESNHIQRAQQQRAMFHGIRHQYTRIDTQQRYLNEENQRIGEKFHQELEQYFESITLTPVQRDCIDGCLSDFKTQLSLLSQAARGVHSQLQMIGKSLTDDTSEPELPINQRQQLSR